MRQRQATMVAERLGSVLGAVQQVPALLLPMWVSGLEHLYDATAMPYELGLLVELRGVENP